MILKASFADSNAYYQDVCETNGRGEKIKKTVMKHKIRIGSAFHSFIVMSAHKGLNREELLLKDLCGALTELKQTRPDINWEDVIRMSGQFEGADADLYGRVHDALKLPEQKAA